MKQFILLFILTVTQLGCAGKMLSKVIPNEGKKPEKVKRVNKIAIVAYDTLEYHPAGVLGSAVPMINTAHTVSNSDPIETELSRHLYQDLREELKQVKFQVLSLDKVRKNKAYKRLLKNMENIAGKTALNQSEKPTLVKGIARSTNPKYQLKLKERQQLARSLGVDAIVLARVKYFADSNRDYIGLGLSKSYLRPVFTFYMFGGRDSELIWFTKGSVGPRSKESLGRIEGLTNKKVIAVESRELGARTMRTFLAKKIN